MAKKKDDNTVSFTPELDETPKIKKSKVKAGISRVTKEWPFYF